MRAGLALGYCHTEALQGNSFWAEWMEDEMGSGL